MSIVKREITRCSIEGEAASTVSINYDDLTNAVVSIEVLTQGRGVRLVVNHLTVPALNFVSNVANNVLTTITVATGFTFTPTVGKSTGGTMPSAEIAVFWES